MKVQFIDRSTHSPASWKWSFGDGTCSTSKNPARTYSIELKSVILVHNKN
ncbi:MAG: PKD domain-containing protein [Methanosarcina barkeri]|nr:PKD domain-containing protein [Methanosarcina sp. ERenArc_MAG2]